MSDLIKREDAMQVAFLYPFFSNALMEEIKAIPSAERKGKWKRKIVDNGWNADFVCSECGYTIMIEDTYPYCPNCGADMGMKGAEDEDN